MTETDGSDFSLYTRFLELGTLTEPEGVPDPRYALPSTVNWMRALALLVESESLDYTKAWDFYSAVSKRLCTPQEENSIMEHLLLSLHQLAALESMTTVPRQADIVRVASVAWYYGVYAAATAMVAAQEGAVHDTHAKTAKTWDRQLVQQGLTLHPFDLRVSTLIEATAKEEIDAIRRRPAKNLIHEPTSVDEAHQAICGYLSGNVSWWAWRVKEDLKRSPEFKALNVSNFRTTKARSLRDERLGRQCISFLHQAIRFRGKANYREALYLAHGTSVESVVSGFPSDMAFVLRGFLAMAGAFVFRRLGSDLSVAFIEDVAKHRSFVLDPSSVWGLAR